MLEDKYNEFLYKDSKGFLWIGSTLGINRYDGLEVISYPKNKIEKESIIGKNVQSPFFEDSQTNIWFSTYNAIVQYNRQSESWKSFQLKNNAGELVTTGYRVFHLSPEKNILWLVLNYEIIAFNLNDYLVVDRFELDYLPLDVEVSYNSINSEIDFLPYSSIYPFFDLITYSFTKGKLNQKRIDFIEKNQLKEIRIRKVIFSNNSSYFFITNKGLYRFDREDLSFDLLNTNSVINLRNGILSSNDDLIICSSLQGLFKYNIKNDLFNKINITSSQTPNLTRGTPRGIFEDSENNFWISYMGEGVEELRGSEFCYVNAIDEKISSKPIQAMVTTKDNTILALTDKKEIINFYYDYQNPKRNPVINQEWLSNAPNKSFDIFNHEGTVFLLEDHSIFQYNYESKNWTVIFTDEIDNFKSIHPITNNKILLASTSGLFRLVFNNGSFKKERIESLSQYSDFPFEIIFGNTHFIFLSYESNQIWVSVLDNNDDLSIVQKINTTSTIHDYVFTDSILFMGTDNGLIQLKENNDSFDVDVNKEFEDKSISVYSITQDQNNHLWLGTNNGLYTYSLNDKSLKGYFEKDGLQSNYYAENAALTAENGDLWFGTDKGLTVFNPHDITSYPYPPKVIIENFKINNEKYPIEHKGGASDFIDLQYNQRRIEFKLLGLTSYYPEKTIINFQLDGLDDQWNKTENGAIIRYPKLSSGQYNFKYFAENINNTRSEVHNLQIHINPPFWLTWWFISLSTIFLLALIIWTLAAYFRLQYQKELEKRNLIYSEQSRISNDVHDEVSQGLSIIRFISEDQSGTQLSKETKDSFQSINEWAKTAQNNLNNIIFSLTPEHNDLKTTFEEIKDYCSKFLQYYPISWNIHFPENMPDKALSGEKRRALFLILKEAIHNAVKHSNADNLNINFDLLEDSIQILIEDDGIGMGEVNNNRGKGLNTMPERAQQVGGTFTLSSIPKQGTRIMVNLPYDEEMAKGFRSLFIKFRNKFRNEQLRRN